MAFDEDQIRDSERAHIAENVAFVAWTNPSAANQPPVADAQTLTTPFQTPLPIVLTGSDPDLDPLTFAIVTPPTGGALAGTAPNLTYTPGVAFSGSDALTFSVSDGRGGSAQAVVSISVEAAPNQPPTAQSQTLATPESTPLPIVLTGSDPDLDPLTFAIVTPPTGGLLSGTAPNVTYTPNAGFLGADSFVFSVSDGRGGAAQGTVSLTVSAVQGSLTAEVVSVSGISSQQWLAVALTKTYVSPVIVCSPIYATSNPPAAVRMRGASPTGFEVRAVRLNNGAQPIRGLTAQCLAVEEGVYTAAVNGVEMEAVKYQSTATDYKGSWAGESRGYLGAYSNPVVVGQVMSDNDPAWSTFWARGASPTTAPTANALFTGKHVAEDPSTARVAETVGYIVIESGAGTMDGLSFQAGVGGASISGRANNPPFNYPIGLAGANAAVVSLAGMAGVDGGWPVLLAPTPIAGGNLQLMIDEDQFADSETWHAAERVAYVVFALP
jgi:hypothetical protein